MTMHIQEFIFISVIVTRTPNFRNKLNWLHRKGFNFASKILNYTIFCTNQKFSCPTTCTIVIQLINTHRNRSKNIFICRNWRVISCECHRNIIHSIVISVLNIKSFGNNHLIEDPIVKSIQIQCYSQIFCVCQILELNVNIMNRTYEEFSLSRILHFDRHHRFFVLGVNSNMTFNSRRIAIVVTNLKPERMSTFAQEQFSQ